MVDFQEIKLSSTYVYSDPKEHRGPDSPNYYTYVELMGLYKIHVDIIKDDNGLKFEVGETYTIHGFDNGSLWLCVAVGKSLRRPKTTFRQF